MKLTFDHFDLVAPYYDHLIRGSADDPLPRLLAARAGDLVLDVGGGTGRRVQAAAPAGARVVVCDASLAMAKEASAKGLVVVVARAAHLPFAASSADRVLVIDALHHFVHPPALPRAAGGDGEGPGSASPAHLGADTHPAQRLAAAELVRVLKPAGRLVVEEPDIRRRAARVIVWMEKLLLMGSRFLSADQLTCLFRSQGAADLETHAQGFSVSVVFTKPHEDSHLR